MATEPVSILAVADAFPPYRLEQQDVVELCRDVFAGRPELFERLVDAYRNAGIDHRSSCVPLDWYREPHGWPERTDLYRSNALDLLAEAAETALSAAGLRPAEVDSVVVVSTTGVSTPSLDAHLLNRLGFKDTINRLPIFGLGCAGGVNGLARASDMARARPGETVLLLVVELCALTFRPQEATKANVIASALFGDGAAALILRTGGKGGADARARVIDTGEHTWPDSLGVMGWRVEEDGLGVIFSRDIPTLVEGRLRGALGDFLDRHGIGLSDLQGVVAHPGGKKVLESYEKALGLPSSAFAHARDVLREQGNMSAVTVLSVLRRTLQDDPAPGRYAMTALGPGFTAGFALLDIV